MEQPQWFLSLNPSLVCKLNKAFYGLKQAPRKWFEILQVDLIKMNLKYNKCDPSLFIFFSKGHSIYLLVYGDDIILTGSSKPLMAEIINKLNSTF